MVTNSFGNQMHSQGVQLFSLGEKRGIGFYFFWVVFAHVPNVFPSGSQRVSQVPKLHNVKSEAKCASK